MPRLRQARSRPFMSWNRAAVHRICPSTVSPSHAPMAAPQQYDRTECVRRYFGSAAFAQPEQEEPEMTFDEDEAGQIVLAYCAAVRGLRNDDQGGPLPPSGLRMSEAWQTVRDSRERHLRAKKGGAERRG